MDNRTMIVILVAIGAITTICAAGYFASISRTDLVTRAKVEVAQEHTKRADGRHQLLDLFGLLERKR